MKVASAFLSIVALVAAEETNLRGLGGANSDFRLCQILQVDVSYEDNRKTYGKRTSSSSFVCADDDGAYGIDLPEYVLRHMNFHNDTYIQVPNADIDQQNAEIVNSAAVAIQTFASPPPVRSRRHLLQTTGTSKVLVLRVNYRGQEPQLSSPQLAGRVFGLGSETVGNDMARQLKACSFGKLVMKPFQGDGITNGVADIEISEKVSGYNAVRALENLVLKAAKKKWNLGNVQHTMIVLPDAGLLYNGQNYLAYGYLRSSITVFKDHWAGRLSALVHELGHNLNLHHSGQNGQGEYGDRQGYMGYGEPMIGGPDMCFNAQKHDTLGWFQDRTLSLDVLDLPWGGYLSAFIDYDVTDENQFVLIKVGKDQKRLYIHFNRAKGMNAGTREFRNQVSIVSAQAQYSSLLSWAQGGILRTSNEPFRYRNYDDGSNLVIQVCGKVSSSPETLRLSIHLDNSDQNQTCNDILPEPAKCENMKNAAKFFVDKKRGVKSCNWLKRRTESTQRWKKVLCKSDHMAYHMCRETCDENCES